jgi:hypothetical protein
MTKYEEDEKYGEFEQVNGAVVNRLMNEVNELIDKLESNSAPDGSYIFCEGKKIKKLEQCCKNCKYWDTEYAKDKAGRIRKNTVAKCLFELPKLPASLRNAPQQGWMASTYGTNCKCYEQKI